MRATVERIDDNRVVLEVEVGAPEFDKALNQAYLKLVKRVNIPGFRKGKAPRSVLERFIGKEPLVEEAAEIVMPQAYIEAVKETAIEPIDAPKIEVVKADNGQPLVFRATVDVKPQVTLGDYHDLKLEKEIKEITLEDVQKELEALRQRHARLVALTPEDRVLEGDSLSIDFEGCIGGEPFEGGKAETFSIVIGSGRLIDGFEEQMVGAKVGEERTINVTFPNDYIREELKGKEATFTVLIKDGKRKEISSLDDEFAKDVSEFDTLEELKVDIENRLRKEADSKAEESLRDQAVRKLMEISRVDVPGVLIERQVELYMDELEQNLLQQGMSMEDFLGASGNTQKDLRESYHSRAEEKVRADFVLDALAKDANVVVQVEEVDAEIERLAGLYRQDVNAVKEAFKNEESQEGLKESLRIRKAVDLLVRDADSSTVKVGAKDDEPVA